MSVTARMQLPELSASQAQKHVTVNSAFNQIDALTNAYFASRSTTTPPSSPADGTTYLVPSGATGAWVGQVGKIAYALDGAWLFYGSFTGLTAYVVDEAILIAYNGSAWVNYSTLIALQGVPMIGVNTTATTTNRLSVKSNGVLFSQDDVTPGSGDMVVTINKKAAANNGTITFQDNFSTRAIVGNAADDNFQIKVSPDGSTFFQAIDIDKSTGNVAIGTTADGTNDLSVSGTNILFSSSTGSMAVTVSKHATANDASITFQDNFSARALIGLLADDNFHFKVSSDGSTFHDAIIITDSTGVVTVASAVLTTADINGGTLDGTAIGATTPSTAAVTTLTASGAVTLSPASAAVAISPTGTGTVTISPAGALTINPTAASTINNTSIGVTTAAAGRFTTLTATGAITLSPASAAVAISPTGTGTVAISPAGALTINPTAASTINNCSVGVTTAAAGVFTTLQATTSFKMPTVANSTVATTMTSLGPTGSHTTIQEWFAVLNASGTTRYVPAY